MLDKLMENPAVLDAVAKSMEEEGGVAVGAPVVAAGS